MNKKLIAFLLASAMLIIAAACNPVTPTVTPTVAPTPGESTQEPDAESLLPFSCASLMLSVWKDIGVEGGVITTFEFGRDDIAGEEKKPAERITTIDGTTIATKELVTDFEAMEDLLGVTDAYNRLVDGAIRADKDTDGDMVYTIFVNVNDRYSVEEVQTEMFEHFKAKYEGDETKVAIIMARVSSNFLLVSIGGVADTVGAYKNTVDAIAARLTFVETPQIYTFGK